MLYERYNFTHMSNINHPIVRIDKLQKQGLELVEREILRLKDLSIVEKLSSAHAKDLRDYIKLLSDMKQAHQDILNSRKEKRARIKAQASTEELERLIKG